MARLYADENFPLPVVEGLRGLGHDVLTCYEAGQAERKIPDEEVLAFARADARAVLTLNRKHFLQLHKAGLEHSGIIACTLDHDFPAQAKRIDDALGQSDDLRGRLLRVNRPS